MLNLEEITPGVNIHGIFPDQVVLVVDLKRRGSSAIEIVYKRQDGQTGTQLLYRNDEPNLTLADTREKWSFDANGELFRLVAEAYRIHLAHLFDPVLVVRTSLIEPLSRQITGVYGDRGLIVEVVVERLTSQLGCQVEITLEISARKPDGFDNSTQRTISENSRTLKFELFEFGEE